MIEKLLDQPYWDEINDFIDSSDYFAKKDLNLPIDEVMIKFAVVACIKKYLCHILSEPDQAWKIHKHNVLRQISKEKMKEIIQDNLELSKKHLLYLMTNNMVFAPGPKYASLSGSSYIEKFFGPVNIPKNFLDEIIDLEEVTHIVLMVIITNSSFYFRRQE